LVLGLFAVAIPPHAQAQQADTAQAEQGRDVYEEFCVTCHGRDLINPGVASFDLRKFPPAEFDRFRTSVLNGKGQGMPSWSGKLSDDDIKLLWAYVLTGGNL
jgi:mono/diheme cytochrome c family protein